MKESCGDGTGKHLDLVVVEATHMIKVLTAAHANMQTHTGK